MNVEQIQEQIVQLSPPQVQRLAKWLANYFASRNAADEEWKETADQLAELDRRLAEFVENPSTAGPFADNYFDNLRKKLADEHPQTTPTR